MQHDGCKGTGLDYMPGQAVSFNFYHVDKKISAVHTGNSDFSQTGCYRMADSI